MSKAILLFLEEHKFHLQISFDGSKSFHNLERKNSIGVGTYDRLLKNVAHLLNESKQISIQIRVNITKNNWKSIGELFSDLVPFSKYDQFVVYFDFVAVPLSSPLYISNSNKLEISLYLINELERYHLPWLKEIVNGGYCMYKNNNAFTIHANGDLYKCYSLVGDDHYIHGSIFKKDINIQGSGSLCEECDCPYYELCYGGCPFDYFAIHNKMEKNCQYHFLDSLSKLVFLAEIGKLTGHDDNLLIQHVKMKPVEL